VRQTAIVIILTLLGASASWAQTVDTVCLRYGPCPLDLSPFACADTDRSSFVRRVCYHAKKKFMAIKLNAVWYPYCDVPAEAVEALLQAPSVGRHYNDQFRSRRDGTMVRLTAAIIGCQRFRNTRNARPVLDRMGNN
jgi:hypothetical protein